MHTLYVNVHCTQTMFLVHVTTPCTLVYIDVHVYVHCSPKRTHREKGYPLGWLARNCHLLQLRGCDHL